MWKRSSFGIFKCALWYGLIILYGMVGRAEGTEIVLRAHVTVDEDVVRLEDVAEILGEDQIRLNEISLCSSPLPGEDRVLDVSYIRRRLLQNGMGGMSIAFSGAEKVTVEGACVRMSGDRVRSLVEDALRDRLDGETIHLTFREVPKEVVLPSRMMDLQVCLPDDIVLQGHTLVYVEVRVDGRVVRRIPISVKVERSVQVVLAKHRIDRHVLITAEDVRVEQREQRSRVGDLAGGLKDVVGRRTKAIIPAGRAIRLDLIETPPALCRGERMALVVALRGLTVRTLGEALEDGWEGDIIRVRNLRSGREIRGMVMDSKTVEIMP